MRDTVMQRDCKACAQDKTRQETKVPVQLLEPSNELNDRDLFLLQSMEVDARQNVAISLVSRNSRRNKLNKFEVAG